MRPWTIGLYLMLCGAASAAELPDPIVAYWITDGAEISESLTGKPGDATAGAALYQGASEVGCPACHGSPGAPGGDDDPKLESAPGLSDVGARLSPGAIRLWLVAPQVIRRDTGMPSYYSAGQRLGAKDPLYGGPALTAGQIEDLVAYLITLGAPN